MLYKYLWHVWMQVKKKKKIHLLRCSNLIQPEFTLIFFYFLFFLKKKELQRASSVQGVKIAFPLQKVHICRQTIMYF